METNDIVKMYMKTGFTEEQALLLNDVSLSLIISSKKILKDLVAQEVATYLGKNIRSVN